MNRFLKILSGIGIALLAFAIGVLLNGHYFGKESDIGSPNTNWMGDIRDDVPLCEVVTPEQPGEGGEPAEPTNPVTLDFTAQGYTNQQAITSLELGGVTVTFDKGTGTAPKYYDNGSAVRVYKDNTVNISVASGSIEKITFAFNSDDGDATITADVGTYTSGIWEGNSSSVTFTVGDGSNRRITDITVTLGDAAAQPGEGGGEIVTPEQPGEGGEPVTTTDATVKCEDPTKENGTEVAAFSQNGITLTFTNGGTKTRWWGTGTEIRIYKNGGSMTVTAPEGKTITSIKLNPTSAEFTVDDGSLAGGTWTGSATSVTFTATETVQLKQVDVTYIN